MLKFRFPFVLYIILKRHLEHIFTRKRTRTIKFNTKHSVIVNLKRNKTILIILYAMEFFDKYLRRRYACSTIYTLRLKYINASQLEFEPCSRRKISRILREN